MLLCTSLSFDSLLLSVPPTSHPQPPTPLRSSSACLRTNPKTTRNACRWNSPALSSEQSLWPGTRSEPNSRRPRKMNLNHHHISDPGKRIIESCGCNSRHPSFLCCRLLTWVWTSALRESLWATDQTVSRVEGEGGRGFQENHWSLTSVQAQCSD